MESLVICREGCERNPGYSSQKKGAYTEPTVHQPLPETRSRRPAVGTAWGRTFLALVVVLLAASAPALADDQHHFNVVGRPRVLDVLPPSPPSVAYVEINAVTFSNSAASMNGGASRHQGGCTQVIRLSTRQAQLLVDRLSAWLANPEEETVLFQRTILEPDAPTQCGAPESESQP